MKKMSIKNAVEYCQTHSNIAISTPTPAVFNELRKYFHEYNIGWSNIINFTTYNNNTFIDFLEGVRASYNCMSYYKNSNYEIIGIIKESTKENTFGITTVKINEKEIILYSDNKTVIVAECEGQKICVNCNFEDDFYFKSLSNIAIKRLMDKINGYKIKVGDIVEVKRRKDIRNEELIGMQGKVINYDFNAWIIVEFPIEIDKTHSWTFPADILRVIHKS